MSGGREKVGVGGKLGLEVKLQKEIVKRSEHQLNYERLKALNNRLETQEAPKTHDDGVKEPTSAVTSTEFGRHVGRLVFDNEIQQLKKSLEKLAQHNNPSLQRSKVIISRHWEQDYSRLFQEFHDFQSSMSTYIRSEIKGAAEKVSEIEEENKRMKIEFEREKSVWKKVGRELSRDKICNECEIRTLREQLDESRVNFLQKSNLCEALSREIDDLKTPVPQRKNQEEDEESLQLCTEQRRNEFLQNEIKTLSTDNEQLLQEIQSIRDANYVKVGELNQKIRELEVKVVKDWDDYGTRLEALKEVIKSHEACIKEMEKHLENKEEEMQQIIEESKKHLKAFKDETLKTIKEIELEKLAMTKTNFTQSQELSGLRQTIIRYKDGVKSHKKLVIQLCKQGMVELQGISSQDNMNNNENKSEVWEEEEAFLQKLVDSVMNVKSKEENFQGRILQLEGIKLQYSQEFGKLEKKCKKYHRLAKKLQSKESFQLSKIMTCSRKKGKGPKLLKRFTTVRSIPPGKNNLLLKSLLEKHQQFQNILDNLSTTIV